MSVRKGTPIALPGKSSSGREVQTGTKLISTRTYGTRSEETSNEYSVIPAELAVMPVRCYTCGKAMFQTDIENHLKAGLTISEVENIMGYQRMCCKRSVQTAIPIVYTQKQIAHQRSMIHRLRDLRIEDTGNSRFVPGNQNLQIIDQAPPGTINEHIEKMSQGLALLTGSTVPEPSSINPFEYFIDQTTRETRED